MDSKTFVIETASTFSIETCQLGNHMVEILKTYLIAEDKICLKSTPNDPNENHIFRYYDGKSRIAQQYEKKSDTLTIETLTGLARNNKDIFTCQVYLNHNYGYNITQLLIELKNSIVPEVNNKIISIYLNDCTNEFGCFKNIDKNTVKLFVNNIYPYRVLDITAIE